MKRIAPVLLAATAIAAGQTPTLTQADMERFLKTARIAETKRQITSNSRRVVLDDGKMRHDASIQTVNVTRGEFEASQDTAVNVKDSYRFNIAAYELSKILGLNMVPPCVEREVDGMPAAVTWWVDDVLMDEFERLRANTQPPDPEKWMRQVNIVRVFDQLVFNTDRNRSNLLITKDWKLWMIDHTRTFHVSKNLLQPENLTRCDRNLLQRLKTLNGTELTQKLKLNAVEIEALLARRDAIIEQFDRIIAQKGEQAVLYDEE